MPGSHPIGIVGGGMLGMALALRLRQAGFEVVVLEGAPKVGGLAGSQELEGYTWDRFYHVTLLSDSNLRGLLAELGLDDRLRWGTTRTGFYVDGKLVPLSSVVDFVRFPPLSLIEKARLAATVLRAAHIRQWRPLEEITAGRWLRRWSGSRTYERLWLPLLRSKLGENHRLASAAFIWAIIARMYAARRSGLKREMFGYVTGGYDLVLRRFQEHLESAGVAVLQGRPVAQVTADDAGAEIVLRNGDRIPCGAAILTVPCGRIPELCPQLTSAEQERLRRVVYQGVVCASVLLRRPLAGYYVTNIADGWPPFTGVIEMTALVDRARFGGNSLVYLPRYLSQDDPGWTLSDEAIRESSIAALERMYPEFRRSDVVAFRVARAREVLALSTLHYSRDALPPLRTSLERVFVVNSAQIASGTLNVNETVGLANRQADALVPLLHSLQPEAASVASARS